MPAHLLRRRQVLVGVGLAVTGAAAAAAARLRWSGEDPAAEGELTQLRLATGPAGGVFRELGGELLKVLAERFPGTRLSQIYTGGVVDNLELLANGDAELAFAYLDSTVAGLAAGRPRHTTAVARLYDAWMHVIVPASSSLRTFAELDGRTITAGAAGSGTRFTTDRLIELTNIRPRIVNARQSEGAALLAAGRVDAWLTLSGMPTPAVTLLAKTVGLRMIPLKAYAVAMERRYGDYYTPATLPSSVYPGIDTTETLTVATVLLARPELPASAIEVVTRALFEERERIARAHPDANRTNVRTAIATAPVPLHPGALRYFRAVKR
ncbi:MAG TPA: TAXI family TRAP transporter solute-binding subunit [Kribbellaceae bacterium]|nr:TAXI family TRAP transporter solute-binding subunit [Kribbellaceae bacterium]